MRTATIRVDTDTHARLLDVSNATGASLIETVRDAAEALRRQRFAHQVADELADLQLDWNDPPIAADAFKMDSTPPDVQIDWGELGSDAS